MGPIGAGEYFEERVKGDVYHDADDCACKRSKLISIAQVPKWAGMRNSAFAAGSCRMGYCICSAFGIAFSNKASRYH
jgi:hypothetical protein